MLSIEIMLLYVCQEISLRRQELGSGNVGTWCSGGVVTW